MNTILTRELNAWHELLKLFSYLAFLNVFRDLGASPFNADICVDGDVCNDTPETARYAAHGAVIAQA